MTLNQPNLSSFLMTKHLTIFCDHKNLSYLLSCPDENRVVLRWIPVLQFFEFDIVHIEGPKNFWADYLSRTNLDSPKKTPGKKERKTRNSTARTKNAVEKCCSLLRPNSVHGNSLSSLFNYLNLAELDLDPITWYNPSYEDAAKVIHPSALRHPKSAFAEINALKHFSHFEPITNSVHRDLIDRNCIAFFFILSTDLPRMHVREFVDSSTHNLNDLIQHGNWNLKLYFHHPKNPSLNYHPDTIPANALRIRLNRLCSSVSLDDLYYHLNIFHLLPLPTHMYPFNIDHNRFISRGFEDFLIDSDRSKYISACWKLPHPCRLSLLDLHTCATKTDTNDEYPHDIPSVPTLDLPITVLDEQLYLWALHNSTPLYSTRGTPALDPNRIKSHSIRISYALADLSSSEPLLAESFHPTQYCCHLDDIEPLIIGTPHPRPSRQDFLIYERILPVTRTGNYSGFVYHDSEGRKFLHPSFVIEPALSRFDSLKRWFPELVNHRQFLRSQSGQSDSSPPPCDPRTAEEIIEISSSSDVDMETAFCIVAATSESQQSESSESLLSNQNPSPSSKFLSKIIKEQQKLSDSDSLFADSYIHRSTGLKMLTSSQPKILIPPSLRPEILLLTHGSVESGHPPTDIAWKKLKDSDFHWPNMKADLISHIAGCIPCQKTSPISKNSIPSTGSLNSAKRPFEYLHCDTIGPLSVDSYGNKYVIHFVDAFSKFSILVTVADVTALTVVNSILVHVYSVFGAPRSIHSDNGPEFSNKIFSLLCQFLNIEHTLSIPHFHQSNGLVERQHRTDLQALRKLLLDFADYQNWSDYIPICQLIVNSHPRKSLGTSPYFLFFGTNSSPRLLPHEILESLKPPANQPDLPDYLAHLTSLTQTLTDSWNKIDLDSIAIEPNAPLTCKLQPGDCVFVLRDKPAKLHGHFVGTYVVEKQLTNSSILVKNPITKNLLKTSIHLVTPCTSSLPKEILDSYVAADKGEHVIDAIDSIENNDATIIWSDGTSTVQPVDSIKNTAAYKRFMLLHEDVPKKKTRGKRKKR
ncbi:hypothetical protein P9112_004578 [Eukaryota sp. TZLM1-RC]